MVCRARYLLSLCFMVVLAPFDTRVVAEEAATSSGPWTISTDFPGGAADVRLLDADTGVIEITPPDRAERGWPCWWYFRLEGLEPGQAVTLRVSANPHPFRPDRTLGSDWSQPDRAAISTDNVTWTQTRPGQRIADERMSSYQFDAPAERVWLAWGPPFVPSDADALIARVVDTCPGAEPFVLARTRGMRPVRGVRIGGGTAQQPARYGVWVQARQHAWEAGSSWVARGFIEWTASDAVVAQQLRRLATIWFTPIMDIDNVAIGAGGKESLPQDHNRDWSDAPFYPEVAAAQQRIATLDALGHFDVFLDLHNPGASERLPYFFGPMNLDTLPDIQRRNHRRWLTHTSATITGPLPIEPDYRFATYVKSNEVRGRMSANWVRRQTAPHVLATTLETVWNTPHSTQSGYQIVGQQLGQALARYLADDPRAAVGQ